MEQNNIFEEKKKDEGFDNINLHQDEEQYMAHDSNLDKRNTVSQLGLIVKTIIGLLIAFAIAIPNLMHGDLFLAWLYNIDSIFMRLIMSIIVTVILGFIWAVLYKSLRQNHGKVVNAIIYIVTCGFAGLFLGNALIIATLFIVFYAPSFSIIDLYTALAITSGATFIAVLGGVIALPYLKMDGFAIKFFKNIATLIMFLSLASGIMWIIGMILAMFNLTFILELLYRMIYGYGPISMFLSVLAILAAEFLFLATLSRSKLAIGKEPKHMENFYAIILVNSIIRIYVEIFKFVLKVIARSKD